MAQRAERWFAAEGEGFCGVKLVCCSSWGPVVGHDLLNFVEKRGQISCDGIPDYIEIDIEITMD